MRRSHADKCAQYLGDDIRWDIAPTNPSLRSVGQSYGRIKVRARDWPERENQRRQRSARGQRIGKQGNGCIAARELFAHDAGANDRSKKERSSQGFCDETARKSHPLQEQQPDAQHEATAGLFARMKALMNLPSTSRASASTSRP